jgi:hypothetical protein
LPNQPHFEIVPPLEGPKPFIPRRDRAFGPGRTRVLNFPASKVDKFKDRYVISVAKQLKSIIDRTSGGIK